MNTLEFLQTILPEEGIKFLASIDQVGGWTKHYPYTDLEQMAKAVETFDAKAVQVYHACSSYNDPVVEVDGKKKYRGPENWCKAKAFWLDLDSGEEKAAKGKGYLTKKDAALALREFCAKTGLPAPMLVDSGNGLHVYWVLTKAIKPATWLKIASRLKAITTHHGLYADPTVTADFSRILRPIGGTNKKNTHKTVKVLLKSTPVEPQAFAAILNAVALPESASITPPKLAEPSINDDLISHLPPSIPIYAEVIASKCAQLAEIRDTKGDVNYEHWRGAIGLIKYCEEGLEKAREWSSERANTGHDQVDVDQKYETWSSPPTTCEFFSKCNPTGCEGCTFKGKIKTPAVLGRKEPEAKTTEVQAKVDGVAMQVVVPEFPKGYGHDNNQMIRFMEDKDGIMHAFTFCANLFYPVHRIKRENGEFSLGMRMHLPDRRTREFEIDTQLLASPQKLIEGLARHELLPTNNKDASMHMTAYLRDSLEKLKQEAEELNTYTSFGWIDNYQGFLIGDRLYHKDGSVRKVLIGSYARDKAAAFPTPTGTAEGYSKALNYLYAREGMEPMQYVVAAGFGSVLSPLGDSMYKGLVFAVVGEETAKGKTTVCWASLYAFGDADRMSLKTEDNATVNARYARMGTYRNIPMLIDEVTNVEPAELSKFAYSVSLGQEKERLTVGKGSSGVRFAESQTWAMNLFMTANKDMHAALAVSQSNTQAEAVRLIQIKIDRYDTPKLKMSEVEAAKKQMFINQGVAGDVFLRYVVKNLDDVMQRMAKWGVKLENDMPDVKYRFYRSHAICSFTALEICNELGITNFNIDKLYAFVQELFIELAVSVKEQNTITPEDALNRMLNDLSPRILVTTEYRDGRDSRGPEDTARIPNNGAAGRYILGNQATREHPMTGKLFIVKKEIQDWCLKHRVDYKHMIDAAIVIGVASDVKEKFNVGRGTKLSAGQHRCVCIDMLKLENIGADAPKLVAQRAVKIEGSQAANN
jgi:hypothetical protein